MSNSNNSNDNDNKKKPWLSWFAELPTQNELRECAEYRRLHDQEAHREIYSENRERLLSIAKASFSDLDGAAIVLAGGSTQDFELYDTDVLKTEFRQESFFRYLFGINGPDCYGAINVTTGKTLLFVPEVEEEWQRWDGPRRPFDYYVKRYGVTEAHLTQDVDAVLKKESIKRLYVLRGYNLDSGSVTRTPVNFPGVKDYAINETELHPIMCEMRAKKTPKEIEMMRLANLISSQAHVYVMRHIHPGMVELQLEALYKSWCAYFGGSRHMAYSCICPSGPNGAILHYGHAERPNDQILMDGDTVVLDMGAEYLGYATDITRSFALNGKFTEDQKLIHNAVYEAQQTVMKQLKPGVYWPDMHRLAERVIIHHLVNIGILHNGTLEEYEKNFLASVFMPHGLGHMLGYDVHDVGGYLPGTEKAKEPGLCWLRCGRKLEAGMVLTVEPGVYFNDPTIDKALRNPNQSKYINQEVLARFRGTGGCRLEDDVLITEDGFENLTVLPTSVEDIEEVIRLAREAK